MEYAAVLDGLSAPESSGVVKTCVCVRERERERDIVRLCEWEWANVFMCECVCVCVCVFDGLTDGMKSGDMGRESMWEYVSQDQ